LPSRASAATIEEDADGAFRDFFRGFTPRNTDTGTAYAKMAKGVSADGWEFMKVQSYLQQGGKRLLGMAFVARLDGGRTAVVVGSRAGAEPNSATMAVALGKLQCLDEYQSLDWPIFFHGLHFKGWKPNGSTLAQKLIGKWRITSSTTSVGYAFAANGRYMNASAYATYSRVDDATVRMTTQGFVGDGKYKLTGNELTMTPDSGKKREAVRVRWQMVWELGSWSEALYLLEKGQDGKEYELLMYRER
jgi:hypothetical protein